MTSQARLIDGIPAVVTLGRSDLAELLSLFHRVHTTHVHRGGEPIGSAVAFVRAARAAVALIDSSAVVPAAEPARDRKGPVEGSWITTNEAARLLGIGPRAVRKRVTGGSLEGRKVGGTLLINSKEMVRHAA